MNHRWRGGGLAAAFLVVVGALVLGPWSVSPASAEKTMLGSIAHALGANGHVWTPDGNRYTFSSDSEGIYHYPGSIPDTSAGYRILTLYFTNPYSAQIAHQVMTDGTGKLVFTRASDTGATAPVTAPTAAPVQGTTANAGVTPGNSLQRLANLLTELEQNIKYASQQSGWGTARTEWVAQLTASPSPAEVTKALQELELSLKASALAGDWNTRRVGWYASLRRATTPAEIAELMKQLDMAITWDAMEAAWRDRRSGWVAEVTIAAAAGSPSRGSANASPAAPATTAPARPAPAATPAATVSRADTSSIARLAELLTSLESSVKPESIVSQWATSRVGWISALQRAASVADLKTALQDFECSVKRAALLDSWGAQRESWYAGLRAATTPAHAAVQLRQLEGAFKGDAMKQFYLMAQGFWRVHVDEVANGTYAPAAVPAPAASVPATTSAIGGNLSKLAALLRDLEKATMYQAQIDTWQDRRPAWVAAVEAATTVAQFRESLLAYEASLKPDAVVMSPASWTPRADWRDVVVAASTASQLALLLKELEAALIPSSVAADWPGRRAAWVAELTAAGTGVAAPPVPPTPARTTPVATAVPGISELIQHLIDLEGKIVYEAQFPDWKTQQRALWMVEVNSATTVDDIGMALSSLEFGIRAGSFKSDWSARRDQWRREVLATTAAAKMKDLAVELENSLLYSALLSEDDWY